jgi:hypothetical protein
MASICEDHVPTIRDKAMELKVLSGDDLHQHGHPGQQQHARPGAFGVSFQWA